MSSRSATSGLHHGFYRAVVAAHAVDQMGLIPHPAVGELHGVGGELDGGEAVG